MQQRVPKEVIMQYYRISKNSLQTLFDILNQDLETMYKLLNRFNDQDKIEKVIESLEDPTAAPIILQLLQNKQYQQLKDYIKGRAKLQDLTAVHQCKEQTEVDDEQLIVQQDPKNRMMILPIHLLHYILDFLDPINLMNSRVSCRLFNDMFQSSYLNDRFYMKFCISLFNQEHTLPAISPFEGLVSFVNHNLHLYQHHNQMINQINNDVHQFIWGNIKLQQFDFEEMQQKYGGYRRIYEESPRLNYCGVYAIIETYLKRGEADMSQTYAPCHLVEYYRYVKFWKDGSVTMLITSKKQNKQKLVEYFSVPEYTGKNNQLDDKFIRGEYIQQGNIIIVKTFRQSTIFTYVYQVMTSKQVGSHPCNVLLIKEAKMNMLGENYTTDLLRKDKKCYFGYKHFEELRQSLDDAPYNWKYITY